MSGRRPDKAAEERRIFERFLRAHPSLAEQVVRYDSTADDFPDIDAYLQSGAKLPVELGEWIDGPQLADALKTSPPEGGYDPAWALDAGRRILEQKLAHYGPAARGAWLVIHYGRAYLYNTPFRGLYVANFADLAREVSGWLKGRTVQFDKVFLLAAWGDIDADLVRILREAGYPVQAGPEAFEVFPKLIQCT